MKQLEVGCVDVEITRGANRRVDHVGGAVVGEAELAPRRRDWLAGDAAAEMHDRRALVA